MSQVLLNYILRNFLKYFFIVVIVIYGFGIILNLFEEIEFFKEIDVNIFLPLMLTGIFVPSMILDLLPFIIFVSSMIFMIKIRNNKDFLILKVIGFSTLKLFFIFAFTSFMVGWLMLIAVNPATSSMLRFYEKTKSQYARDIDHLVNFNRNGLWIKENLNDGQRIVTAKKLEENNLIDVEIFHFNKEMLLRNKMFSKKVNIENYQWILNDIVLFESNNSVFVKKEMETYIINSNYNHQKIINLFNNSKTISFLDLVFNIKELTDKGYDKDFIKYSLHSMLVLPFFLFLMTGLAAILTMHTFKRFDNYKFIIIGLIVCVLVYYLKDLSLALGKTGRVPEIISIWSPVITLSFFTFIGVLQINEK